MSDPRLIERQNAVLQKLEHLVRDRAQAAADAESAYKQRKAEAAATADANAAALEDRFNAEYHEAERSFRDAVEALDRRFQIEHGASEQEYVALKQRSNLWYKKEKAAAKKTLDEATWETQTVFDATKNKPRREFVENERQVNARADRLAGIANEAKDLLAACRLYHPPELTPTANTSSEPEALKAFIDGLARGEELLVQLKALRLPKLFQGATPFWMLVLAWFACVYPAGMLTDWQLIWVPISLGAAIVLGGAVVFWLYQMANSSVRRVFTPLCQTLLDAEQARARWVEEATARWRREATEIKQKHETEIRRFTDKYNSVKDTLQDRRDAELAEVEAKYPPRLAELKNKYQEQSRTLETTNRQRMAQLAESKRNAVQQEAARAESETAELDAERRRHWQELIHRWNQGLAEVRDEVAALAADTEQLYLDWDDPTWNTWTPPHEVARAVKFGELKVRLDQFADAENDDKRLASGLDTTYRLPALLSFPQHSSLAIRAAGAGRARAVEVLQAVMLRFLTAVPPGKLRFTIVDPVGLGQNFAGFMHLADYEEALVSHKILTEPQQIEQKLADLTGHMSNVIQKYLRNEYETIEDYNREAGEVAEPFRVLVIANFPFGFTDAALRYLMSIVTTGARCGVYTLISIDTKLPLPHGFRLADLEASATRLAWRDDGFVWRDDVFEKFPLTVQTPPSPERFSQIVHLVGQGAKNANRVEVPFEFIAPPEDQWWTSDSSRGIDVALGRAGATKRQLLRLGRGTAQHVLIAGKTGSGKSTLMHALITNLALLYSPDEVQLYLIDFKKGVEFKTYAEHALPHARVVAIESEREFGLSVLQRLDAELKLRGDLFRDLNVADVKGYREAGGTHKMPRILLVVDEFQEFFVEDDKIGQDVTLLLDRLVRQGRAFGIHVHLGSQTLGGAYSLPRATLGQFAIRIALQCSEADANLILSEENSAARLLTRPGEAIYNDANGRSEGNNLFQVVYLNDERQEYYLNRISQLATERHLHAEGQIVFEGNVPADVEKNHLLEAVLASGSGTPSVAHAWLGDAIAIKDPTAATFREQSGNNMLLIGQQAEAALAMMQISMIAIAAQQPAARFYVLDGQAPDSPTMGIFPKLKRTLPQPIELGGARETAAFIATLEEELQRRQASSGADLTPWYLFVYDLQRFRELRKTDDDFSFSRGAEKASPAKQLVNLLREGPALGIHIVVWADTLNNVQRSFDRQTMREFETRVLFQMSVSDSSTLIDSPMASKLGPHRAFLHSEEQGRLEKFRPYRLPEDTWLKSVHQRLASRSPAAPLDPTIAPDPGAIAHET
jgi:hypothetical protein